MTLKRSPLLVPQKPTEPLAGPSLHDFIHLPAATSPSPPCWRLSPQLLPQRATCIKVATVSSIFPSWSLLFFAFDLAYAGGQAFVFQLVNKWKHLGSSASRWLVPCSSLTGSGRGQAAWDLLVVSLGPSGLVSSAELGRPKA